MTEPAVGASTWASGSQVWKGNIGTLMANPTKKARNTQNWRPEAYEVSISRSRSKVYSPVAPKWAK